MATKQTDEQMGAEVKKHWHKLMNSLIKAYHEHDMSIEISCQEVMIKGYHMGLPDKEYTSKDKKDGTSDGVEHLALTLEKIYYTE